MKFIHLFRMLMLIKSFWSQILSFSCLIYFILFLSFNSQRRDIRNYIGSQIRILLAVTSCNYLMTEQVVRVCVCTGLKTDTSWQMLISGELKRVKHFSVPTKSNVTNMRITGIIPSTCWKGNAAILYFTKYHISIRLAARHNGQVKE